MGVAPAELGGAVTGTEEASAPLDMGAAAATIRLKHEFIDAVQHMQKMAAAGTAMRQENKSQRRLVAELRREMKILANENVVHRARNIELEGFIQNGVMTGDGPPTPRRNDPFGAPPLLFSGAGGPWAPAGQQLQKQKQLLPQPQRPQRRQPTLPTAAWDIAGPGPGPGPGPGLELGPGPAGAAGSQGRKSLLPPPGTSPAPVRRGSRPREEPRREEDGRRTNGHRTGAAGGEGGTGLLDLGDLRSLLKGASVT